jgi:hypothetical protein
MVMKMIQENMAAPIDAWSIWIWLADATEATETKNQITASTGPPHGNGLAAPEPFLNSTDAHRNKGGPRSGRPVIA